MPKLDKKSACELSRSTGDFPALLFYATEAIAACQRIVDEFLAGEFEPGMSATDKYELYTGFGDDPFIVTVDFKTTPAVSFSAWRYVRERCNELAARGLPDRMSTVRPPVDTL